MFGFGSGWKEMLTWNTGIMWQSSDLIDGEKMNIDCWKLSWQGYEIIMIHDHMTMD